MGAVLFALAAGLLFGALFARSRRLVLALAALGTALPFLYLAAASLQPEGTESNGPRAFSAVLGCSVEVLLGGSPRRVSRSGEARLSSHDE